MLRRPGAAKTVVADVATESGVSRATIYRRSSSIEDIFMAVLTDESQAMTVDCKKHLAHIDDPVERIIDGMRIFFTIFSNRLFGRC